MKFLDLCRRRGSGSGCGGELDGVAELFELSDEEFAAMVGLVFAGEVVRAELVVGGVVGEEVPADDDDGVGDGDQGALIASSFGDPSETNGEVAIVGAHGGPRGF